VGFECQCMSLIQIEKPFPLALNVCGSRASLVQP
jgi:hypothetical protein